MSSIRDTVRTEQSLRVATFLGGLTLTGLTFISTLDTDELPTPITLLSMTIPPEEYKELLVLISGLATALLITSVFGLKGVLVHGRSEQRVFAYFAIASYEAGYVAILLVLPLLVLPFSGGSAAAILFFRRIMGSGMGSRCI